MKDHDGGEAECSTDIPASWPMRAPEINPTAASTDSANLQSREFNVAFYHLPLVSGIRELRTDKIGTLMSISGTVTRTSEVRPELLYGSFICEVCNGLVNDIEQQFKYTEVCC